MDLPPPNAAVDRHGYFGLSRRVIGGLVQDDEPRAEVADEKGVSVHAQLHANVCRVAFIPLCGAHELQR
jgi:hypothetical protein